MSDSCRPSGAPIVFVVSTSWGWRPRLQSAAAPLALHFALMRREKLRSQRTAELPDGQSTNEPSAGGDGCLP